MFLEFVTHSQTESVKSENYRKLQKIVTRMPICDVIKQNESELANIDFEIEPIIVFNFLCIFLF